MNNVKKFQPFVIASFEGYYRFLSNFYPVFPQTIILDDMAYPTVEHAFQATKRPVTDKNYRKRLQLVTSPGYVKKIGNETEVSPGWEENKLQIMETLIRQKFTNNEKLRDLLLKTGNSILIEGNYWNDQFWGVFIDKNGNCKGENNLGKLLMKIRKELRGNSKAYFGNSNFIKSDTFTFIKEDK